VEFPLDGCCSNLEAYPVGLGDGVHLAVGHPGRLDSRSDGAKVPVALILEMVPNERACGSGVHKGGVPLT
jgi:hypothetical protein